MKTILSKTNSLFLINFYNLFWYFFSNIICFTTHHNFYIIALWMHNTCFFQIFNRNKIDWLCLLNFPFFYDCLLYRLNMIFISVAFIFYLVTVKSIIGCNNLLILNKIWMKGHNKLWIELLMLDTFHLKCFCQILYLIVFVLHFFLLLIVSTFFSFLYDWQKKNDNDFTVFEQVKKIIVYFVDFKHVKK